MQTTGSANMFTPLKVVVRLKEEQRIDYNTWECHVNGEKKIVPSRDVSWHVKEGEMADAIASINVDEVERIEIGIKNWKDYI